MVASTFEFVEVKYKIEKYKNLKRYFILELKIKLSLILEVNPERFNIFCLIFIGK